MIENKDEKYKGITTYKIGEVARRTDVNKETVRYYEKRKLIPKPDRRRSGYRIFTQHHIDQIKFIKRAQQLGFTLSEIKELLELRVDEETSCSEIKEEAQRKYQAVSEKIEALLRIQETLTDLIDSCTEDGPIGDCPILEALEGKNETGKRLRK
ncbi:heavy metal-responsive transcriptional regulator [Fodinibius sediminis]|uniref:MerR family transcriptional regulator, mercuric resistance operon regulatory protein n=1 Tax=Fodinibius sediminis TaxID=1214077 RepID=A0A521BRW2_9BACT|nr:heavy metal-responsive transcriptional regulator [Fodinibius sediminis]SMO49280.1 MerR family transcriptional regulator, mercuric resistance operon regulatory protein [Fodinibius sediminis]